VDQFWQLEVSGSSSLFLIMCESRRTHARRYSRVANFHLLSVIPLLMLMCLVSSPLMAQMDPSGEWAPPHKVYFEDDDSDIGDYTGIPINDAARFHADTWEPLVELPENLCKENGAQHSWRAPVKLRIWKEVNPETQQTIAYRTRIEHLELEQTIYMDGRQPPPDYAAHTFQGFSTGRWDGGMLAYTTDHLKADSIRWNGVTASDMATMSTHFLRHGDSLTIVFILYDPLYLTEPLIHTLDLWTAPRQSISAYPCEPFDVGNLPKGVIPSHASLTNPFLDEFAARYGVPPEAARGGAETMYPEYIAKMKTMKKLPRPAAKAAHHP
jgi:hypothetical protein